MSRLIRKSKYGTFFRVWTHTWNVLVLEGVKVGKQWAVILPPFILILSDLIVMRYTFLCITTNRSFLTREWIKWNFSNLNLNTENCQIYTFILLLLYKSTNYIQFENLDFKDCGVSLSNVYLISKHWKMLQGVHRVEFGVYFSRSFQRLLVKMSMPFSLQLFIN